MSSEANPFEIPDSASSLAGARFFEQHARDLSWIVGYEFLAREMESFTQMIASAIRDSKASSHLEEIKYSEASSLAAVSIEHRGSVARKVAAQSYRTAIEALLCRYVDNFLCYVCDLIALILREQPSALVESDATISLRDVFAHDDLPSLQVWLIEKKINELSFQGFIRIAEYCAKRFDLELIPSLSTRKDISICIASRNLIVHRRGIIDDRFMKAAEVDLGKVGQRLSIDGIVWDRMLPSLLLAVHDIDDRAARKFKLQSAFVLRGDEVSKMQADFLSQIAETVMRWRTK
ncbi:hypothetical protein BAY61_18430 [Prauserella marina]|uniref:Uncharacterized protein n=1 Tax=Prauserella marina TaxID=530584 RepID=A0A222VS27_9PSEU|nr:hypothetical protein [Prauserella marina]ASR36652.1 hypothetical protein BAY61_18430 [Prauserella marina]PWV74071.1 hypothetical protein DES30_108245 [Prauserella marina]SDD62298.1 hypothetical protein SAMN05421630_110246 [Prauserella marina]